MNIPKTEIVSIDLLRVDGNNPNSMTEAQREALKKNITKYGFLIPIITNKDLLIADGQHRYEVAKEMGYNTVPVVSLPIKEVDRRILRQVLNKLRGTHEEKADIEEYRAILQEMGDFSELASLIGTQEKEYSALLKKVDFIAQNKDDEVPDDKEVDTRCQKGDLWILGEHKLYCGDSTLKASYEALMGEERADMVF